jgi:DNA-binding SARP family transcriptional activator
MRPRTSLLLPRLAAALAATIVLALLACLWVLRPALPRIASISAPISTGTLEDAALCLAWLLLACLLVGVLLRTARRVLHASGSQRRTILPGVIPGPLPPRDATPLAERFQPPIGLSLRPPLRLADDDALLPSPRASASSATGVTCVATAPSQAPPPGPSQQHAGVLSQPAASICLLGPLRIQGTRRPPKRTRTRELIAYLALHPNGASRDELTEAICPDGDPQKTRARLWEVATDARASLGEAWITEGERYRLDREKLRIDLDDLDRLLDAATDEQPDALEAALALWRGTPLQGSDYAWADGHIHRLHATLIGLLERAGHARLARGDARGALQMAEQAIALDQLHEPSWRLALQADHALGLRESLTHRYQQLARELDEQLGLQPTRETRMIYKQLLGQN